MKKVIFLSLFTLLFQLSNAQTTRWRATVKTDGGDLPFGLELQKKSKATYKVFILNAAERFQTDDVTLTGDSLTIPISLFDAQIVAKMSAKVLEGTFSKNKGRKSYTQSPFKATLGYLDRFRTNKMAILGKPQEIGRAHV